VLGSDVTVATAGAGGHFELNAMVPLMAAEVLESIELLANAARLFAERCVDGLQADAAAMAARLERSPMAATVLNPLVGYEKAAELAKEAAAKGVSVKSLALERGLVTPEQADTLFDFRRMTGP
jgi:fumarate hydratase class II